MSPRNKLRIAKLSLVLATVPIIVHAYEYGPPPGVTGAPGDQTCSQSGCHTGTPNTGGGSVKIILPTGNTGTYVPGQTMQLMVQITDSTKKAFGFEMTARLASNPKTAQAGDFNPVDANTQVICADGSTKSGSSCNPPFGLGPIEDIEHTDAGFMASINSSHTFTYTVNWTPPASATAGNVTLYVAANCGIGLPAVQTPTNIYLSMLTLTPAAASSAPAISSGGVVPIYSTNTTIQPGSWVSIYGTNLANTTALWNGNFLTTLGGTSVKIDNKAAYMYTVSPTQINVQAPDDTATGTVPVVVTSPNGSASSTVTLGKFGPSFSVLGGKYVAGIIFRTDGSGAYGGGVYDIIGPNGSSLGFATKAAKAGDTIEIFGVGFGPTNPPAPAGQPYAGPPSGAAIPASSNLQILIGGSPVTPAFAGITQAGLFQFNLALPTGLGTGDVPLSAIVGGIQTPAGVFIALQ
jgi:uncharacterized protein (TIGR03437 family)